MKTRLTLSIEKSTIEKAKRYAQNSGKNLSEIVESYLEKLVASLDESEEEVPEEFKEIFGCVNLPTDQDDKEVIKSILYKKHIG